MLVDPLSEDPIVVCGSANFSRASIVENDENMIIVRGNKRIADIYLGEYMRLWSHHAFRESLAWRDEDDRPKHLKTGDWWRDSFEATERKSRREFFAPPTQ
jgi:phosphatidylserine/phosphatidylglycerophosphate/cardiolipin synthase-like enzyme